MLRGLSYVKERISTYLKRFSLQSSAQREDRPALSCLFGSPLRYFQMRCKGTKIIKGLQILPPYTFAYTWLYLWLEVLQMGI